MCFIPKADKHKSAPYKETPSLRSESSEKPRESPRIGLPTQGKEFRPRSRLCHSSLRPTSVPPCVQVLDPAPLGVAANRGAASPPHVPRPLPDGRAPAGSDVPRPAAAGFKLPEAAPVPQGVTKLTRTPGFASGAGWRWGGDSRG